MSENELIRIWQESTLVKEKINHHSPKLLSNMDKELERFERRIERRDRREIIVALLHIPFFSVIAYSTTSIAQKIGSLFLIAYCLWVIYYLLNVKNKKPPLSVSLSLKAQLIAYRAYILQQQKLVRDVLYWYLLPILPGLFLFWIGFTNNASIIVSVIFLLIGFPLVYRLNQRAATENYDPLLAELSLAIEQLEE